jgi:hypothetical protein
LHSQYDSRDERVSSSGDLAAFFGVRQLVAAICLGAPIVAALKKSADKSAHSKRPIQYVVLMEILAVSKRTPISEDLQSKGPPEASPCIAHCPLPIADFQF